MSNVKMFGFLKFSVNVNDLDFSCLVGEDNVHGAYIAIINFGVVAKLSSISDFSDIRYNADKIYNALLRSDSKSWLPRSSSARKEIAVYIAEKISDIIKKQRTN